MKSYADLYCMTVLYKLSYCNNLQSVAPLTAAMYLVSFTKKLQSKSLYTKQHLILGKTTLTSDRN